jgi:hypothetical protein
MNEDPNKETERKQACDKALQLLQDSITGRFFLGNICRRNHPSSAHLKKWRF